MTCRTAVDCIIPMLLLPLMAYSLIGEIFHEAAGTVMLGLILMHLWHNRAWLKSIAKGRHAPPRTCRTACFLAMLAAMSLQMTSGILMSGHVLSFLAVHEAASYARTVHLCSAYWCFTLMGLHAGLHAGSIAHWLKKNASSIMVRAAGAAFVITGLYGALAFARRGFAGYMFLQSSFAFFNFDEPLLFFLADYAAIFCLFMLAGHLIAIAGIGKARKQ